MDFLIKFKDNLNIFTTFLLESLILILFFKFRKRKKNDLDLDDSELERLVNEFVPSEMIDVEIDENELKDFNERHNWNIKKINSLEENLNEKIILSDLDFYENMNENKEELEKIIKEYGVGTCGPPGFYGTLDIHLELENVLEEMIGCKAILYSNAFTCINSVIYCFCRRYDQLFFHSSCNEGILRGICASKCVSYEFKNFSELENKLEKYFNNKKRNFVVVEGIFKNTGEILNLPEIIKIKKKFDIFLIVDESMSLPLLNGISNYFNIKISEIDIIIGSLLPFCSNGGFIATNKHAIDYQRLLAPSYCFSASLPGFLAKNAILNIKKTRNIKKIKEIGDFFFKNIKSKDFEINFNSPIIVIKNKKKIKDYEKLKIFKSIIKNLSKENIFLSLVINPEPGIRIYPKISLSNDRLKNIVDILNNNLNKENSV